MNKYLNKNIDIYYYTYNNDESKNVNYDTLKIVGIYDNNTNIIDENICYAHKNLIEKIYNKSYENYNQDNITPSIFIRVDNINDCKICDDFLTLLIHDEKQYDEKSSSDSFSSNPYSSELRSIS